MQVQLLVANKSQKGEVIPVSVPAFRIGRAKDCQLRSNSSKISRRHCVINTHDDTVTVLDLGSENGTYINGKRIASLQELKDGDELKVGRHSFVLSIKTGVGMPQPAVSENDFFILLSDSADRADAESEPEDSEPEDSESGESTVDLPLRDITDEPDVQEVHEDRLSVVQRETLSPDLRRHRETPSERKQRASDYAAGRYVKIGGIVLAAICLLGIFGNWMMSEPTNLYGAVHVVGTLTLDGEPVAGASVILHPRDRDAGRAAGGITDRQGRFTVRTGTAPMVNGAVPGEYDVTFRKIEVESPDHSTAAMPLAMPSPGTQQLHSDPSSSRRYVIPQKYGNPRTSGLAPITVEATGRNSFTFELFSVASP